MRRGDWSGRFTRRLRWTGVAAAVGLLTMMAMAEPTELPEPRFVLVDARELAEIRQRIASGDRDLADALRSVVKSADEALRTPIISVIDKPQAPPSGDKRDYMSLSPYWWPNPETPDGLPYVWRDGQFNPERDQFDLPKLEGVAYAVRDLGFAYHFTGEEKYAAHAAALLRTFFLDPEKGMNPNLTYAQFRPGHTMTHHGGIIETNRFRWMIDAMVMLEGSSSWTPQDAQGMRDWFGRYVQWLTTSEQGVKESQSKNNHGTWWAAQVVLFARFAGDDETARAVLETVPARIAAQIEHDGSQPHEARRTQALHYHDFNLRAMLDLAQMGKSLGYDLVAFESADGRSLRKAVDFLVPYVLDQKDWPHQQISDVKHNNIAMQWRMASRVFDDPAYEQLIGKLPGGHDRLDSRAQLAMPPIEIARQAKH